MAESGIQWDDEDPDAGIQWDTEPVASSTTQQSATASAAPVAPQNRVPPGQPFTDRARQYFEAASLGGLPLTMAGDAMGFDPANAMRLYGQGMARGYMDEGVGAMESGIASRYLGAAATGALPVVAASDALGLTSPGDTKAYEAARDRERALLAGSREDLGPTGSFLAEAAGGVWGPRSTPRAATAVTDGAVAGGGYAETLAEVPRMVALGGATGYLADRAGEMGGNLVKRFLASPLVNESAAAKYLRSKGVDALTVGQMNPKGVMGQVEEASTSVGGVGPAIQGQRNVAREQWQGAVLDEARPPGMTRSNRGAPIPDQLDEMYSGFGPAYAPARGLDISPQTSAGLPLAPQPGGVSAFDSVLNDANVLATDEQRRNVQRFLANQVTLLPKSVGPVSSDVLLTMRSNIREKARQALKAQDFKEAELLSNAADVVTDSIEHQLPGDALQALRDADSAYRRYKVVEDAVYRAGDNEAGFSPYQLSQAVKGSTERGAFARGGGDELRELAKAGREVFDVKTPPTGARLLVSGPAQWATAPASYFANLGPDWGPKAFLRGETGLQRGIGAAAEYGGQAASSATRTAQGEPGGVADLREWLGSVLASDPQAMDRWALALEEAATTKGPEGLAVAHHDLAQQDPEYQARMRRAGGQQP